VILLSAFEVREVNTVVTKRIVLSAIARVFDPMGFISPILARAKVFLKKLWLLKLDWDVSIPENFLDEWYKVIYNLELTTTLEFPRFAYDGKISLIVFCDSSKLLYGFACYFISNIETRPTSNLIFSKLKNAPKKGKTLPTLELMSAYLALRCLKMVINPVKDRVMNVTVCLDSQVALSWILTSNVKSKNVYAQNRVKDISVFVSELKNDFGLTVGFKYVPTDLNPADLLTRGISFSELKAKEQFWFHGPEFLLANPIKWPNAKLGCLSEKSKILTLANVNTDDSMIDVNRFSNVNKLIRVTSLVLKFVNKLRKLVKSKLELMNDAKHLLIKTEQSRFFDNEFKFLRNPGKQIPSLVRHLNLFIDDTGLIRCKGRLANSSHFCYDAINPILIPRDSALAYLLIDDVHAKCKHLGVATTLTAIRKEGLWIPKGRSTVKTALSRCIICKKLNALSFKYPKKNDYIEARTDFVKPYDHTGIDFTGHMFVKLDNKLIKMYLLVFTCLNIRSVHLELVPDMSCKSFLMAFVRFCNLYNFPSSVYSDNASTFMQGLGILTDSSIDNEFMDYLVKYNIKHVRIPLYAAWVGSAWERMIKTIKNSLHKVIGRKHMPYFELLTILSDVENAINNRPLTYRSDDDLLDSISPNSFLKFNPGCALLLDAVSGSEITVQTRETMVKALEIKGEIFDSFKQLWVEEYLLSLREASQDVYQDHWTDTIRPDDVVLISTPNKPRTHWMMGRVMENLPGKDGRTRCVRMMRPDRSEGVYPISSLYPLELSVSPIVQTTDDLPSLDNCNSRPPERTAAKRCKEKIASGN